MDNVWFRFLFPLFLFQATNCDVVDDIWPIVEPVLLSIIADSKMDPDAGLNISSFMKKYDYPLEVHNVTTEDGYILTVHRVPYGVDGPFDDNDTRPAVLLSHCLSGTSMDYIWAGPNNSLAFLLADEGYDVWLVNKRGNKYSLSHETLTVDDADFWDFSFHKKGYYDLPATVDYILDNTGLSDITYVGHSQGTTESLVMTSTRTEYNDKLNLIVMFSPIVYTIDYQGLLWRFIVVNWTVFKAAFTLLDIHGLVYDGRINLLAQALCGESSPLQIVCFCLVDSLVGFDFDQIDKSTFTVYLSNTPGGISVKEIEHYQQEYESGEYFRQYDYGSAILNYLNYGSLTPPEYDLSAITAPIAVYYGQNDYFASVTAVEKFLENLGRETEDAYLIEYEYFNHLDFVFAKDVKTLVYDRVIDVLSNITNS